MKLQQREIYLAGPITGLSYGEARHGWREEFDAILYKMGPAFRHIKCRSPMRAKQHLETLEEIGATGDQPEYDHFISKGRAIVERDRNDVRTSDAVVFNFLGASVASVGSCIEIGWADAFRVPTVLIIEDYARILKNPHEHLMVDGICGYRVNNLQDAAFAVANMLTPGI